MTRIVTVVIQDSRHVSLLPTLGLDHHQGHLSPVNAVIVLRTQGTDTVIAVTHRELEKKHVTDVEMPTTSRTALAPLSRTKATDAENAVLVLTMVTRAR